MHLRPLQQPHPPLWYGLHSVASADRVARQGWNVVTNDRPSAARASLERYRQVWTETRGPGVALPRMGLARHIVVAATDAAALAIARRAYKVWLKSFAWLFDLHGTTPSHWQRSTTFDILRDSEERGVAGSPETVLEWLSAHIETTGANYLVGQHQFGDMTAAETQTSLRLYAAEVMPALRRRFR